MTDHYYDYQLLLPTIFMKDNYYDGTLLRRTIIMTDHCDDGPLLRSTITAVRAQSPVFCPRFYYTMNISTIFVSLLTV